MGVGAPYLPDVFIKKGIESRKLVRAPGKVIQEIGGNISGRGKIVSQRPDSQGEK